MDKCSVSIVVPAFNEAGVIEETTIQIRDCLIAIGRASESEILLIDDGSTDETGAVMETLANEQIRVIHQGRNYGRGKALKRGFLEARGDVIITLDADLSYSVDHIPRLLDTMAESGADIVSVSPFAKGGIVDNVPFARHLMSRVGNKLLCFSMGVEHTVITCIVRAYKSSAIKAMELSSDGKDLHPEILFKARTLGYQVEEIPGVLRWSDEKVSHSKVKRRSKFRLGQTVLSHLFVLFYSRPNLVFSVPGLLLFLLGIYGTVFLSYRMYQFYLAVDPGTVFLEKLPQAVDLMIQDYSPTLIMSALALVFGLQFLTMGLLSIQNKKNFEEVYRLVARRDLDRRS